MASALFGCAVQERLHQRDDSPDRRRRRHRRIRRRRFAGGPCSLLRRRLPHFSPQRSEKFRVFLGFLFFLFLLRFRVVQATNSRLIFSL